MSIDDKFSGDEECADEKPEQARLPRKLIYAVGICIAIPFGLLAAGYLYHAGKSVIEYFAK